MRTMAGKYKSRGPADNPAMETPEVGGKGRGAIFKTSGHGSSLSLRQNGGPGVQITKRYPTPRTVSKCRGLEGFSSR